MDIHQLITAGQLEKARDCLQSLLAEESNVTQSRQTIQELAQTTIDCIQDPTQKQSMIEYVLERLEPRAVAFEESITALREKLARIHEDREEWRQAASVLSAIPLESSHRIIPVEYKVKIYIHIVRLLLEDDHVDPGFYLNRAALLMPEIQDEMTLLMYKVCQTKLLDTKRKFLEASQKYHELSLQLQDPQERTHALTQSAICCALAPHTPQRHRLLALLHKDERTHACAPVIPELLQTLYLGRLLRSETVAAFTALLSEHHTAVLADGSTVVDRAVMEHNVFAVSRLYVCIRVQELGRVLGVSAERAEEMAARMMAEGRLSGFVDQADGFVYFDDEHPIVNWDQRIAELCHQVNEVAQMIEAQQ